MDTIKACQARAMAWANRIEAERLDKPELFQKENYKVINSTTIGEYINKKDNNYKAREDLKWRIHTEEAFLTAQSWGMYPGALINLCRRYGSDRIVEAIKLVTGIGNGYFSAEGDVNKQRGAYCRAVIVRGLGCIQ